jgi:hypothetical protein
MSDVDDDAAFACELLRESHQRIDCSAVNARAAHQGFGSLLARFLAGGKMALIGPELVLKLMASRSSISLRAIGVAVLQSGHRADCRSAVSSAP